MTAIWFGLLFLSGSWLFLTPIFVPNFQVGMAFIVLGSAFNVFALRKIYDIHIDNKYHLICLPLLISVFVVPFPYNIGFVLTITGLAAFALLSNLHWRPWFGVGLIFSGLTLIIQSAFLPLYFRFASRYHQLDFVTPLVYYLLKISGIQCALIQNTLFIQSAREVFDFTATVENIGAYPWLNICIGALIIVLFLARAGRGRWLILVLCGSLGYLFLRYVGLILLYLNFEEMSVFWNAWLSIGSFVPLMLIFLKFIPLEVNTGELTFNLERSIRTKRNHLIILSSTFIAIFLLIGFWGFQDPGIIKKGRILIDEKHSNWEWTTRKYDTQWFGQKSGYNYYCLWDYLNHYYKADRNFEAITSQLLENYDVLIIKTPTSKFSGDEINSIREFVKNGGGLFLIGDHTNVFGTSSYINPIAEQFGLRFNYDATYDLITDGLSVYKPPKLLPHPIVQYLPPFLFGSSCSLEASWSAEDVIIGYGLKALDLDYSQKNFFPEQKHLTSMRFGLFLQSAGLKYGKGRVLAFTDSTVFSNFWMFIPGKPELFLGSINWLNRQNCLPYNINSALFIIGLLFLGMTFFFTLRKPDRAKRLFIIFFSSLLAFPLASHFYQTFNHNNYPAPQPHTKFIKVCFELEHSDLFLPILELVKRPERSYHTFYVWTQRLGYVPMALPKLQDSLMQGDIVIIINPVKHFTSEDRSQVLNYVNRGGRVIIMDSSLNKNSSANELLKSFDMSIDYKPRKSSFFYDISGRKISTSQFSARVKGGESVLLTKDKGPIFSIRRKGQGLIAVITDSRLFSDRTLGTTSTIPTPEQQKLYELEFWMLKEFIVAP